MESITMTNSQTAMVSFVADAVVKMADARNMNGDAAREVLKQDHKNPANQIALCYLSLNRQRLEAARQEKDTGVRGNDPIVKPEYMLTFVQSLMNQICWNGRRLFIANSAEEFANGIDFSQDVAEQVGVSVNNSHISEIIDDDFMTLNNLHTWLAGQMSYLTSIEPLFHFSQTEKIDDAWVVTHQCTSFDDAMVVMTEIVEQLDVDATVKQREEAATIDFSAAA
jgi:hypothetical protein